MNLNDIDGGFNKVIDKIEQFYSTYNVNFKQWYSDFEFYSQYESVLNPETSTRLTKVLTGATVITTSTDEEFTVLLAKSLLKFNISEQQNKEDEDPQHNDSGNLRPR